MLKIYTIEKDTDNIMLMTTYTGKLTDIQETLAVAFTNHLKYDKDEPLGVEVDYSPEASDYFLIEGRKVFLDCYVVGSKGFGFMNLYTENIIL